MRDNAYKECERISCEAKIKKLTEEISELLTEKGTLLFDGTAELCPTCGHPMPLEATKAKRAERVSAIDAKVKCLRIVIDDCQSKLSSGELTPCDLASTMDLEASLASYREPINFDDNKEYQKLTDELNVLNTQAMEISDSTDISDLKRRKGSLLDIVETVSKELGIRDKLDVFAAEINALRDERKALACEMAHLEGVQAKCQEYIEERANIISNRINSRLGGCQVRMFNIQKNGERTPDCVLTDKDGVNYATLSTSAKIRVNIDVQELFRSHYGVHLMTWVDECSIFDSQHLPKPDGQCCYLFAGDSPTLVVE
jgi:DNA repair exonuclease SbcCD ATPase subunit